MSEQESKPKAAPKAKAKAEEKKPADFGFKTDEVVEASYGEAGENPDEVGFRGVKPADEDHTVEAVTQRQ